MSTAEETTPTQPAIEVAPATDPTSLHVRVGGLEVRVTKVEKTLDETLKSIDGNLAALAGAANTVVKDPDFKKYLLSILGTIAAILTLVLAGLAGRQSASPAPAPAPAITVVVPKEAHAP